MSAKKASKPGYSLHVDYERALIMALACRPLLWERVGRDLDPDRLRDPSAVLALRLMHDLVRERGRPVRAPLDVLQEAQTWRQAARGGVTHAAVMALAQMFDRAAEVPLPDDDAICARLVPLVRVALAEEARRAVLDSETALATDPEPVQKMLTRIEQTGKEVRRSVRLGPQTWALIEELRHIPKLPTGIVELDALLHGGAPRGTLSTLVGAAKSGKSTWLVHVACYAMQHGIPVAFASLELAEHLVAQKMKSNLTGVPLRALVNGQMSVAREELEKLVLAPVEIGYFAAGARVEEIDAWLDDLPAGGLLCVDYADRMGGEGKRSFEQMRDVYQRLSDLVRRRQMWGWTASQATREAHGSKHVGLRHVAGSIEKIRIADLILTLTKQHDHADADICITNRHGISGDTIQIQTHFDRASFS